MASPSDKSPDITDLLDKLFGRTVHIGSNTCVFCKQPATNFRDKLSEKEYSISGICQQCQDDTFGSPDAA